LDRPRKELVSQRDSLRVFLRGEISKFCRSNFENVVAEDLVKLYDILLEHRSVWFFPLTEFQREFGKFKAGVLKGAPLHSTVRISPWKLQTEYPEHDLVRDLAVSLNEATDIEKHRLAPYRTKSWRQIKEQRTKAEIADLIRRRDVSQRTCVLSCFNLIEAYINGLSWGYVQTHDISNLSRNNRDVLTESEKPVNIITKLTKVPALITGRESGPLHQTRYPLKSFIEIIKPYRDAIVHASPFSALARFGGYDKLSKLYELNLHTVGEAVEISVSLIGTIHRFIGGTGELPMWFPQRTEDGQFILADQ
jgi:hypothetical protein